MKIRELIQKLTEINDLDLDVVFQVSTIDVTVDWDMDLIREPIDVVTVNATENTVDLGIAFKFELPYEDSVTY